MNIIYINRSYIFYLYFQQKKKIDSQNFLKLILSKKLSGIYLIYSMKKIIFKIYLAYYFFYLTNYRNICFKIILLSKIIVKNIIKKYNFK